MDDFSGKLETLIGAQKLRYFKCLQRSPCPSHQPQPHAFILFIPKAVCPPPPSSFGILLLLNCNSHCWYKYFPSLQRGHPYTTMSHCPSGYSIQWACLSKFSPNTGSTIVFLMIISTFFLVMAVWHYSVSLPIDLLSEKCRPCPGIGGVWSVRKP